MEYLNVSNVIIGLQAENKEKALEVIISKMEKNGYVNKEYLVDVLDREREYPTGIPTDGIKVAIPHAKAENVIEECVGIGILDTPVQFKNMADESELLDVEIIFVLANKHAEKQLDLIGNLMDLLSEPDKIMDLKKCKSEKELIDLLNSVLVLNI